MDKLASVTEPTGPESSAATFGGAGRRAVPRWAALISTIVIAALVGGLVGVGVTLGVQRLTTTPAPPNQPSTQQVTITETSAVSQVVSHASPAVVAILSSPQSNSSTSGFLVSANGYLVTNVDAVAGASQLSVLLPDTTRPQPARPIAEDCQTGIAILQVSGVQGLPTISFGSSSTLAPGQTVVMLGGAAPYQSMASQSLISGTGRQSQISNPAQPSATELLDGTLVLDQSFDNAWSGGPVLNLSGQVVGVLVHGQTNFVIPSNAVQQEVQTFLASGQLVVASLGVTSQYVNPIQAAQQGTVAGEHVIGVTPGGPADLAGIRAGDILTTLGGQRLTAQNPLPVALRRSFKPAQKVTVGYERAGAQRQVELTLGQEVPSC